MEVEALTNVLGEVSNRPSDKPDSPLCERGVSRDKKPRRPASRPMISTAFCANVGALENRDPNAIMGTSPKNKGWKGKSEEELWGMLLAQGKRIDELERRVKYLEICASSSTGMSVSFLF